MRAYDTPQRSNGVAGAAMSEQDLAEVFKPASHWNDMYMEPKRATWHAHPKVASYISNRLYGSNQHWLAFIFNDYLLTKPKRLLSIGCGDGEHELAIARNGFAEYIEAFDASDVGIAKAQEMANRENLNVRFRVDDFDEFIAHEVSETFDAVMFIGSLHHVENLEAMLDKVRNVLTPDGVLIYNEYVGPCYIILPEERVALINRVLRSITPEYKISDDAYWRNPTMEEVIATDPSEAVRSALIPQLLRVFFDVKWERGFGGGLLHPLFQRLNENALSTKDVGVENMVDILICMERILEDCNAIPSDFVLGVAQHKIA